MNKLLNCYIAKLLNRNNNITIKQCNNSNGFTFIELILYISIVTVMLTAIVPFGWSTVVNGVKSSTQQEVYSQARYVSERLKYEIRNANLINSVSETSIDLNTALNATTVIDLLEYKIRIRYGAGPPINLNSDDTAVTFLTFTNYTSADNKTKHIEFAFTIESKYSEQRQEYKETVTLLGSAEVRSN